MDAKLKPYSQHPSFAHWSALLGSLGERTGKSLEQWAQVLKDAQVSTPAECRLFLKNEKLGSSSIGLITDHLAGKSPDSYDPHILVAAQFGGVKKNLLPVYEAILQFVLQMGDDVKVCPCTTMVPFYRKHVFAQVKAGSRARLDLGLALGNQHPAGLINTGGFAKKDRITHRLELTSPADFNDFAKDWLDRAYKRDSE